MSLDENKAVLRAFIDAINAKDWARVESLAAEDIIRNSSTAGSPRSRGRDGLLAFLRGEAEAFPDAQETIEFLVAEGDLVAARLRFRGTQLGRSGPYPPTGGVLDAGFIGIFRIREGKVAEVWVEFDNLNSLIQLGHYTPPPG